MVMKFRRETEREMEINQYWDNTFRGQTAAQVEGTLIKHPTPPPYYTAVTELVLTSLFLSVIIYIFIDLSTT